MYENIQEGQYLIKLLSSAIHNAPLKLTADDLDWETMYRLASFHNVANIAYYSLLKYSNPSTIPEGIWTKFASDTRKYMALEAWQHFEIRQLLQQYEKSQIFCMPLSGYVMKRLYPRPDMRYIATMEFFIRKEDKTNAHQLMTSMGYTFNRSTNQSITYFKAPNLTIELLTSLMPESSEYYDYFYNLSLKRLQAEPDLNYIHTMSTEDFYIYLIAYLAQQYASGNSGIRSILDICIYLKRYNPTLDREYITAELGKLNLGLFSFYIEELAWIWFGNGVSFSNQSLYEEMEQHIFSCKIHEHAEQETLVKDTEPPGKHIAATLTENGYTKLFPEMELMTNQYPILYKMPFLLPIFWLVRLSNLLLAKVLSPWR